MNKLKSILLYFSYVEAVKNHFIESFCTQKPLSTSNKEKKLFDFDGCAYLTPTKALPFLEDAIDMAMLNLLRFKLHQYRESKEHHKVVKSYNVINDLNEKYYKYEVLPNKYHRNPNSELVVTVPSEILTMNFGQLMNSKHQLFAARFLCRIITPEIKGNHRISGMLGLGLGITKKEIELFYRGYATIDYSKFEIKPNPIFDKLYTDAKAKGEIIIIWTDNSSDNVIMGMKALGYNYDDVFVCVDMFACNGGLTKKTEAGVRAAIDIFTESLEEIGETFENLSFYDDNPHICAHIASYNIPSFNIQPLNMIGIMPNRNVFN